jgi:hypothetical protein
MTPPFHLQNIEPSRNTRTLAERVIAMRVYEICVERGYVDGHDWDNASRELRSDRLQRDVARPGDARHAKRDRRR